jgi:hypothetical protein
MSKRTRIILVGGLILVVAILACLTAVGFFFLPGYIDRSMPETLEVIAPPGTAVKTYSMPAGQQDVLNLRGAPQAFTILFYQQMGAEGYYEDIRQETWTYYDRGKEYVFINGELAAESEIAAADRAVTGAPFRPEQFVGNLTLDEVEAGLGLHDYARQLILGFKYGQLCSVQALALFAED